MSGLEAVDLIEFCICHLVYPDKNLFKRNDFMTVLKRFLMSSSIQPAGPESTNWLFETDWMDTLFGPYGVFESFESFDMGKMFVDLLLDLDVDVKLFMVEQQKNYPKWEGNGTDSGPQYDIVFDYVEGRGWVLGFEWNYDTQDSGFLVVSEYSIMATEAQHEDLLFWPYGLRDRKGIDPTRMRRFNRRMAAKAQKELKLSGQRLPPSGMPGSWII